MLPTRLKPLARATRLRPVQRRIHYNLSRAFEESAFRSAQVLSEGYCRPGENSEWTYSGSTMITVPLAGLGPGVAAEISALPEGVFEHVLDGSVRMRLRAMRLAMAEATRRCVQGQLGVARVESLIRLDADALYIDVDIEAPVQHVVDGRGEA